MERIFTCHPHTKIWHAMPPTRQCIRHVLSKNFSRASARETPSPQRDSGKPGQRRLPLVLYTNIVMGHLTKFCLMCHAFPRGFSWYFSMFPVMKFLFFYGKLLVLSRNLILLHWACSTWPIAFFTPFTQSVISILQKLTENHAAILFQPKLFPSWNLILSWKSVVAFCCCPAHLFTNTTDINRRNTM